MIKNSLTITDAKVDDIDSQEILMSNLEYNLCDKKAKIVMNYIYNSLSQSFLKYIFRNTTTLGYWNVVERNFIDSSQMNAMQLRWKL